MDLDYNETTHGRVLGARLNPQKTLNKPTRNDLRVRRQRIIMFFILFIILCWAVFEKKHFLEESLSIKKIVPEILPFTVQDHLDSKYPLKDVNLNRVRITHSQLARVDFRGSIFSNLVFEKDDLTGADFRGTTIVNAQFLESQMAATSFYGSTLIGVSFRGSDLRGANFQGTTLIDCDFSRAVTNEATHFPDPTDGLFIKRIE